MTEVYDDEKIVCLRSTDTDYAANVLSLQLSHSPEFKSQVPTKRVKDVLAKYQTCYARLTIQDLEAEFAPKIGRKRDSKGQTTVGLTRPLNNKTKDLILAPTAVRSNVSPAVLQPHLQQQQQQQQPGRQQPTQTTHQQHLQFSGNGLEIDHSLGQEQQLRYQSSLPVLQTQAQSALSGSVPPSLSSSSSSPVLSKSASQPLPSLRPSPVIKTRQVKHFPINLTRAEAKAARMRGEHHLSRYMENALELMTRYQKKQAAKDFGAIVEELSTANKMTLEEEEAIRKRENEEGRKRRREQCRGPPLPAILPYWTAPRMWQNIWGRNNYCEFCLEFMTSSQHEGQCSFCNVVAHVKCVEREEGSDEAATCHEGTWICCHCRAEYNECGQGYAQDSQDIVHAKHVYSLQVKVASAWRAHAFRRRYLAIKAVSQRMQACVRYYLYSGYLRTFRKRMLRPLKIRLLRCRNLPTAGDPYVYITVVGPHNKQTWQLRSRTIKQTLNPEFQEIILIPGCTSYARIYFTVCDEDAVRDTVLGQACVTLSDNYLWSTGGRFEGDTALELQECQYQPTDSGGSKLNLDYFIVAEANMKKRTEEKEEKEEREKEELEREREEREREREEEENSEEGGLRPKIFLHIPDEDKLDDAEDDDDDSLPPTTKASAESVASLIDHARADTSATPEARSPAASFKGHGNVDWKSSSLAERGRGGGGGRPSVGGDGRVGARRSVLKGEGKAAGWRRGIVEEGRAVGKFLVMERGGGGAGRLSVLQRERGGAASPDSCTVSGVDYDNNASSSAIAALAPTITNPANSPTASAAISTTTTVKGASTLYAPTGASERRRKSINAMNGRKVTGSKATIEFEISPMINVGTMCGFLQSPPLEFSRERNRHVASNSSKKVHSAFASLVDGRLTLYQHFGVIDGAQIALDLGKSNDNRVKYAYERSNNTDTMVHRFNVVNTTEMWDHRRSRKQKYVDTWSLVCPLMYEVSRWRLAFKLACEGTYKDFNGKTVLQALPSRRQSRNPSKAFAPVKAYAKILRRVQLNREKLRLGRDTDVVKLEALAVKQNVGYHHAHATHPETHDVERGSHDSGSIDSQASHRSHRQSNKRSSGKHRNPPLAPSPRSSPPPPPVNPHPHHHYAHTHADEHHIDPHHQHHHPRGSSEQEQAARELQVILPKRRSHHDYHHLQISGNPTHDGTAEREEKHRQQEQNIFAQIAQQQMLVQQQQERQETERRQLLHQHQPELAPIQIKLNARLTRQSKKNRKQLQLSQPPASPISSASTSEDARSNTSRNGSTESDRRTAQREEGEAQENQEEEEAPTPVRTVSYSHLYGVSRSR